MECWIKLVDGLVPGSADEVLVSVPAGSTRVDRRSPAGPVAGISLDGGGSLSVDGSMLTVTGELDVVHGTLRLNNGRNPVGNDRQQRRTLALSGGTLDKVTYQGHARSERAGRTLTITNGITMTVRAVRVLDLINLTGAGQLAHLR